MTEIGDMSVEDQLRKEMCEYIVANQNLAKRIHTLEDALRATWPVVTYVSTGRRYVDVQPYPDATARRVAALIDDAIGPMQP